MSNSQLASKNPGSGAGVRRVATASDRLPTIDFSCSDPQAPFEDIINRIMESYAISLASPTARPNLSRFSAKDRANPGRLRHRPRCVCPRKKTGRSMPPYPSCSRNVFRNAQRQHSWCSAGT